MINPDNVMNQGTNHKFSGKHCLNNKPNALYKSNEAQWALQKLAFWLYTIPKNCLYKITPHSLRWQDRHVFQ